jgi:hypothetical protein
VTRQVSHCAKAKEVQHRGKPNIKTSLLHNVKGDSRNKSVTTFTSCKSMADKFHVLQTKQEVQESGKPNIKTSLLHHVKGDSQSQLATTFISCKSVTRQI